MGKLKSPYLANDKRLADVIAAIQTLATYKFYKLSFADWSDRISGDTSRSDKWQLVFEQHPEFFRLDSKREKASLVWRRQHPKLFHVDQLRVISKQESQSLSVEEALRLSRGPLDAKEITALIGVAISLYGQSLETRKDNRWLWTSFLTLLGVVLGAALTAALRR